MCKSDFHSFPVLVPRELPTLDCTDCVSFDFAATKPFQSPPLLPSMNGKDALLLRCRFLFPKFLISIGEKSSLHSSALFVLSLSKLSKALSRVFAIKSDDHKLSLTANFSWYSVRLKVKNIHRPINSKNWHRINLKLEFVNSRPTLRLAYLQTSVNIMISIQLISWRENSIPQSREVDDVSETYRLFRPGERFINNHSYEVLLSVWTQNDLLPGRRKYGSVRSL